jgi:hypothetical protein
LAFVRSSGAAPPRSTAIEPSVRPASARARAKSSASVRGVSVLGELGMGGAYPIEAARFALFPGLG